MDESHHAYMQFIFKLNCIQVQITKDTDAPLTQQMKQNTFVISVSFEEEGIISAMSKPCMKSGLR
jgi:hypothetical protein